MQEEAKEKQKLLDTLREQLAELLCSDQVREEEKLARIKRAKAIFEYEEV
jgi:hypothetical protein